METFMISVSEFVAGLPGALQFVAVLVIGVIPFLESYVATALGTLVGVPVVLALIAGVIGTVLAVFGAAWLGSRVAHRRDRGRELSDRQQRLIRRVDRYGVPIASLLAPTVIAISLATFVMVSAGLSRRQVIVWNIVAAVAWGALFALIAIGALQITAPTLR